MSKVYVDVCDWTYGWIKQGILRGKYHCTIDLLFGLDQSIFQIKTKIVTCHAADSKLVKEEVNGTVILPPPFSIPWIKKERLN